ncbi:MAG: 4-hydroxy-tetrahydrodipicolinate reductase [Desulfocapsa sp.]|nr:4-hydroxy-tetrahydrodipicolinate reductase [Desulfocapsa sp.]
MKVLLSGCSGAMGRTLSALVLDKQDIEIVTGVDKYPLKSSPYPVYTTFKECNQEVDVIIDFSHPSALDSLLEFAVSKKLPLMLSTTGHSDQQKDEIKKASESIPIFMSANLSLGINLLVELVKQASSFLEGFDIEIIEKHHHKKLDSPSGTALMIAESINETLDNKKEFIYGRHDSDNKRKENEIGIHAVRGGTIVGEHQVHFIGTDEVIEIKHSAHSKTVFAEGTLRAAQFITDKSPGIYSMKSMLG